jgi:hypothetical protein
MPCLVRSLGNAMILLNHVKDITTHVVRPESDVFPDRMEIPCGGEWLEAIRVQPSLFRRDDRACPVRTPCISHAKASSFLATCEYPVLCAVRSSCGWKQFNRNSIMCGEGYVPCEYSVNGPVVRAARYTPLVDTPGRERGTISPPYKFFNCTPSGRPKSLHLSWSGLFWEY